MSWASRIGVLEYTTFPAFSLQTLGLIRGGGIVRAGVNIAASVVLCVSAVGACHLTAAHYNGGAVQIAQLAIEEES